MLTSGQPMLDALAEFEHTARQARRALKGKSESIFAMSSSPSSGDLAMSPKADTCVHQTVL